MLRPRDRRRCRRRRLFSLGDRGLGTHLYRTSRLAEGAAPGARSPPRSVAPSACAFASSRHRRPGADPPASRRREGPRSRSTSCVSATHEVASVRFDGADRARPDPAAIDAPSLPPRSSSPVEPDRVDRPVLAVTGVRTWCAPDAPHRRHQPHRRRRSHQGSRRPADARARPRTPVVGVARHYARSPTLVIDPADEALADRVEAEGIWPS